MSTFNFVSFIKDEGNLEKLKPQYRKNLSPLIISISLKVDVLFGDISVETWGKIQGPH